jgi:drug/metabolite transporter (DMT)-like permease
MKHARFYLIGFAALMLFDTWTQVAFKLAARNTGEFLPALSWFKTAALSHWIYAAIAGYGASFVTWMTLLKHAPVGPAFAASHLEVVAVLAISLIVFGERLSPSQIAGAACIVAGIIMLSVSESKHGHA